MWAQKKSKQEKKRLEEQKKLVEEKEERREAKAKFLEEQEKKRWHEKEERKSEAFRTIKKRTRKVEQKRILEHLEFTFKEKVEEKVTEIKKEVEEKSHGHPKRCRGKGGRNQERRRTNKRKLRREGLPGKLETSLVKLKPPPFDGTTSWSMYKKQFEAAAEANNWDDEGKAVALTLALRGQAVQILQTLPVEDQKNYAAFVKALELRYGDHHLSQVYQSQLRARVEKSSENLQEFAADVERLVHLAYPNGPGQFHYEIGTSVFVDGVRDGKLQLALRLARHKKCANALVHALEFEAAKNASRPTEQRLRAVTVEEPTERQGDLLRKMTKMPEEIQRRPSEEGLRLEQITGAVTKKLGTSSFDFEAVGKLNQASTPERVLAGSPTAPRVLSVSQLKERNDSLLGSDLILKTATGEAARVLGKADVRLELGSVEVIYRVVVADIVDDYVLGLDVMNKFRFVLDIKNRMLQTGNEEFLLHLAIASIDQVRVIVSETVRLQKNSEQIVLAELEEDPGGYRTGIIDPDMTKETPIMVARNTRRGWVTLQKGLQIGRYHSVLRVVRCEEEPPKPSKGKVKETSVEELFLEGWKHLTDEQIKKAKAFIRIESDAFATADEPTGRTNIVQHRINIASTPATSNQSNSH
ncbi:hypothetical protein GEV33_003925 [Tenebrio molitor]|uniref:Retrotransposon gag domain-containing protein n=1 Tax=Tenebrio molitor TaxID=7067 RepID=A0A8J6HP26_TENMO|nr:hypothetical protein GEV33_003925 [Tenebrio molitor]